MWSIAWASNEIRYRVISRLLVLAARSGRIAVETDKPPKAHRLRSDPASLLRRHSGTLAQPGVLPLTTGPIPGNRVELADGAEDHGPQWVDHLRESGATDDASGCPATDGFYSLRAAADFFGVELRNCSRAGVTDLPPKYAEDDPERGNLLGSAASRRKTAPMVAALVRLARRLGRYRRSLLAARSSRLPVLAYSEATRAWRRAIAFCPRKRACPLNTHWRPTTA
jgi:hypothetical protein